MCLTPPKDRSGAIDGELDTHGATAEALAMSAGLDLAIYHQNFG